MGTVVKNAHSIEFAKGGSGKMFGKGHASEPLEGVTAKKTQESGSGGKFAVGGKGKMFGKGAANRVEEGVTAKKSQ